MTAPETALYLSREAIEQIKIAPRHLINGQDYRALTISGADQLCATALAAHDLADRIAALEAEAADAESELALTIAASSGFQARAKREIARAEKAEAELAARDEEIARLVAAVGDHVTVRGQYYSNWNAAEAARDEAVSAERERCAQIADGWLLLFGEREPQYVSGGQWARDAVADIRDAIRSGARALPALPASEPSPRIVEEGVE